MERRRDESMFRCVWCTTAPRTQTHREDLCDVARGWVGSCVITVKKLRELAGKSRPMAVRLRPGRNHSQIETRRIRQP